ncbi:hypothetical protein ACFFTN_07050 [Aminobacter aganoensis]|uniref:Uncharacterized protein n=1 Tax=Aminobacter aganoensis TaxID=83264 RepID=A0A7X0FD78_9HYPH|nr:MULTISPECIES: hypothetical protein [Aminobacter]KQU72727.1 hypothetical protein ASC75_23480 [Aminobacter sp. DSM 101952]MBB6357609.1 hypothetical protein [Aminobacter aganoensis]
MQADKEWDLIRPERQSSTARASAGILRLTLLFGFAAVALTLIATPYLADRMRPSIGQARLDGLDYFSTGSVGRNVSYTLRRSVLQDTPQSVCVIRDNGRRSGQC